MKRFLCSSPLGVMSWPLCSHNLNLKDDPSVFSPHNSLSVNPPLRLNHGCCFTRAGSRSVPQGRPVVPCRLSCPPGTQQTGAVLHADLLELKYPFQRNSHGLLILISVEQKPGFITEGKPANRTAQWFQFQQPTSEPSSPVPAAPPRPATTGRCKVLPRINAWRALPRTKSAELGPSGTSVDLFATKHDKLDDFMFFFFSKTPSTIATSHWVSHGTVCIL